MDIYRNINLDLFGMRNDILKVQEGLLEWEKACDSQTQGGRS